MVVPFDCGTWRYGLYGCAGIWVWNDGLVRMRAVFVGLRTLSSGLWTLDAGLGDDQPGDDNVVLARPIGSDGHHVVACRHVVLEFHADFIVCLMLVLNFHSGTLREGEMGQFNKSTPTLLRLWLSWCF